MAGDNKNTTGTGAGAGESKTPEVVTLESLALKLAEQAKLIEEQDIKIDTQNLTIGEQNEKIGNLVQLIQDGKATATAAAGKEVLPTIPTEPLEHEGKSYKWNVAAFSLPGSPEKFTAAEASVTPELIDRLLNIEGQKALQELV
jgi:uncharacterized coiled-coil protein SlyX